MKIFTIAALFVVALSTPLMLFGGEIDEETISAEEIRQVKILLGAPSVQVGLRDKNTRYIFNGLIQNHDLFHDFLYRREEFREQLREYQTKQSVCIWERHELYNIPELSAGVDAVDQLTDSMLARLLFGVNYFNDILNVRSMGALIEEDLADVNVKNVLPTEKGGLLMLDEGRPRFAEIRVENPNVEDKFATRLDNYRTLSDSLVKARPVTRSDFNSSYIFPDYLEHQIPFAARFHLHATTLDYDNKEPCGPSVGIEEGGYRGDVGYAYERATVHGEFHSFVISNIAPRIFSVHYIGAERKLDSTISVVVINLPIQMY